MCAPAAINANNRLSANGMTRDCSSPQTWITFVGFFTNDTVISASRAAFTISSENIKSIPRSLERAVTSPDVTRSGDFYTSRRCASFDAIKNTATTLQQFLTRKIHTRENHFNRLYQISLFIGPRPRSWSESASETRRSICIILSYYFNHLAYGWKPELS